MKATTFIIYLMAMASMLISCSKEMSNKLTKISSQTSPPNGYVQPEWIKENCGDYQYEMLSNEEMNVTTFQGITIVKQAVLDSKNPSKFVTYFGGFSTAEVKNKINFSDSKYNFLFNDQNYKELLKITPYTKRNNYFDYSKEIVFKAYNPDSKKLYETKLTCPSDIRIDMSNLPKVPQTGERVYLNRNASIQYNQDSKAKGGTLVVVNSYGEGTWTSMDDLQNESNTDKYISYLYFPKAMDGTINFPLGFWDNIRTNGFVNITIYRVNYDFIKSSVSSEKNHLVRCGCNNTISAQIIE